jgi:hypothetical protein
MINSVGKLARLEMVDEKYNALHTSFEAMKSVDNQNRATSFVKQAIGRLCLNAPRKPPGF